MPSCPQFQSFALLRRAVAVLLLSLALEVTAPLPAHSGEAPVRRPLKIYIITDLEGASGVYKFSQTREVDSPLYRPACEYLMGDIAAVVRGLRSAGVEEILVVDGHGTQAFVPHLMEKGARYVTGVPRPGVLWGLDNTYAGLIFVGQHAMAGTADGVLHHTQSSKGENRYWYNGVESGELAQVAAYAAHFGVPPVLVTGDDATCREARKFFGEPCLTVSVKQGLARESAVLLPFEETREALFDAARKVPSVIPLCRPYVIQFPVQARKESLAFDLAFPKGKLVKKEGQIESPLKLFEF